ncbi:hypothetical protein D7Z26_24610 [Cohnella endophytica]|uniref:S-layer homology domain-containing protein n=1 Tax=Cohnella endophytica TaxID=2419778 RepID=A0A494XCM7_9BACL|nr:S-layer homology domain-containing protein [Cohnella endophytica]RKP46266.1 hypothetical protein D7Z26_24610 [Cohnella endophytica]
MARKRKLRSLLTALALAIALQSAAVWGTPTKAEAAGLRTWQSIGNFAVAGSIFDSKMVFGGGSLWLAWLNGDRLYVNRLADGGWVRESADAYAISGVSSFDFAVSPEGQPYVAYSRSNDEIAVAREESDKTWSVGDTNPSVKTPYPLKMSVDGTGRAYVVAIGLDDRPTVAITDGDGWLDPEPISGGAGYMPDVAVDAGGLPAAVFMNKESGFYEPIVKSRSADGAWHDLGMLTPSGNYPELLYASDGALYLFYNTNYDGIFVWKRDMSGAWTNIGHFAGFNGSMAVDPTDGRPFVGYIDSFDPGGTLHAVKWDGTAWNALGSLAVRDYSWYRPITVTVGDDGTPYIAYTDSDGNLGVLGFVKSTTPPALVGMLPENGEESFADDGKLELTFDGPVRGVAGKKITVCDASSACETIDAAGVRVISGGETVEILPDGHWPGKATLTVSIEAGAFVDENGNAYEGLADGDWRFTVKASPPRLAEKEPSGTIAANHPVYLLKFDKETLPADGYITVYRASDDQEIDRIHVVEGDASPEDGWLTFLGDAVLPQDGWLTFLGDAVLPQDGESYYVLIDGDAFVDAEGIPFAGLSDKTGWTFKTVNENVLQAIPPLSPANGSSGAANVESLKLTFSGAVTAVQGKKILVFVGNGDEPFAEVDASAATVEGAKATLPLPERLPAGSTVFVFVERGAFADADGNPFAGILSSDNWRFDTASAPRKPTIDRVQAGDGQLVVYYTPGNDGGSPITTYKLRLLKDGVEVDSTDVPSDQLSMTWSNLQKGGAYVVEVAAGNTCGISDYASATASPYGAPGAPTSVTATADDGTASVAFSPGPLFGGTQATYEVVAWDGFEQLRTVTGSSSPISYAGLTNGRSYTFAVTAVTEFGRSPQSARSQAVIPSGPPEPPTGVSAVAGDASATVTFAAPARDGGKPITGYKVTTWNGGTEVKTVDVVGTSLSVKVNGLTNGTPYMFTVKAVNEKGESIASSASTPVTPNAYSGGSPGTGGGGGGNGGGSVPVAPGGISVIAGGITLGTLIMDMKKEGDRTIQTLDIPDAFIAGAIAKLKAASISSFRIDIPDAPEPIDLRIVKFSAEAAKRLSEAGITLGIRASEVGITMPPSSLQGVSVPVEWKIEPIRNGAERTRLGERAGSSAIVAGQAGGGALQVRGTPVQIDASLQGRAFILTLPFGQSEGLRVLPSDTGVYVEHSDGTIELLRGTFDPDGNKPSIAFKVNGFSTFAVVGIAGWDAFSSSGKPHDKGIAYIGGYPGGLFKPNQGLTRAEMASILNKLFGSGEASKASQAPYPDIPVKYWARDAIAEAARRGWMKGSPDGRFRPEAALTRAEMATLLAAFGPHSEPKQGQQTFSDIQGHWAETAIRSAQANGYLNGYADGTFRPDRTLTRAEAVAILNRLLGREGKGSGTPVFSDVPASHWAFEAIQAASSSP